MAQQFVGFAVNNLFQDIQHALEITTIAPFLEMGARCMEMMHNLISQDQHLTGQESTSIGDIIAIDDNQIEQVPFVCVVCSAVAFYCAGMSSSGSISSTWASSKYKAIINKALVKIDSRFDMLFNGPRAELVHCLHGPAGNPHPLLDITIFMVAQAAVIGELHVDWLIHSMRWFITYQSKTCTDPLYKKRLYVAIATSFPTFVMCVLQHKLMCPKIVHMVLFILKCLRKTFVQNQSTLSMLFSCEFMVSL